MLVVKPKRHTLAVVSKKRLEPGSHVQVEGNTYPLKDVLDFEPIYDGCHIAPDFPANAKADNEVQQTQSGRMLGSGFANDVDYANVDQIDEQLE